jgi:hypothetical protein
VDLSVPLDVEMAIAGGDEKKAGAKGKKGGGAGRGGRGAGGAPPAKRMRREVMGTAELARLWSSEAADTDSLLRERNFSPALDELIDSLLEDDRDQTIDEPSKLKHDRRYTWRMLRLFQREHVDAYVKSNGSLATDVLLDDLRKQRAQATGAPAAAAGAGAAAAAPPAVGSGAATPAAAGGTPAAAVAGGGVTPMAVSAVGSAPPAAAAASAPPPASSPSPSPSPSPTPTEEGGPSKKRKREGDANE